MPARRPLRRIYLAHPLPSFGTPLERASLRATALAFPAAEVVNTLYPTGEDFRSRYRREIRRCDALVFFPWRGAIGLGVFIELGAAAESALPILLLRRGRLYREWRLKLLHHGRLWRRYAAAGPFGPPLPRGAQPAEVSALRASAVGRKLQELTPDMIMWPASGAEEPLLWL